MYVVFYSTSDVFKAEEILIDKKINCKVVPTPVQDKAYCGVCLQVKNIPIEDVFSDMEYKVID